MSLNSKSLKLPSKKNWLFRSHQSTQHCKHMTISFILVPLLNPEMHATCLEKGQLYLQVLQAFVKDSWKYLQKAPAQVMFSKLTVNAHNTVPALLGTVEYTVQNLQNVHKWTTTNANCSFQNGYNSKNKVFWNIMQTESQYSQQTITEMQLKTPLWVFFKSLTKLILLTE